ncbi:unnamed protein product [Sphagnum troendelagicum]|uniref:ADF-H domain-containing protein n=1 Tax=Sphagnum troendelagicum TaxID=128251 RepID=A0ABP0US72_9BRYO
MFPACNGKQEAGEVDFAKCTPLKLTLLTQEVLWSVRADQLRIPQPSRLRLVMFFAPGANSASGMSVSNDCKQKFMELKRKRTYRSPDTSRVKAKMMYASSKDCFQRELDGVHYVLQATDASEMDMDVIRDRAN